MSRRYRKNCAVKDGAFDPRGSRQISAQARLLGSLLRGNNGSPPAKFYTDDDRRAVTVEIPIHPDFLEMDDTVTVSDGTMTVSGENPPVDEKKSIDSVPNATFVNEKSCVSPTNATFVNEKSCVSLSSETYKHEKSFVLIEKVSFEETLMQMEVKERTRENIRLLKRALMDDIFSRTDIAKLLRISSTAAGN